MEYNVTSYKNMDRSRTEKQIMKAIRYPLTIVVSPTGCGKTTIIQQVLKRLKNINHLWLYMEQDDKDSSWIWRRLCRILENEKEGQKLAEIMLEMKFPRSRMQLEYIIKVVSNTISRDTYFVIDDYHECQCSEWDHFIEMLSYSCIPGFHIILIGREYPNISYEELILKGHCKLIEHNDLMITQKELNSYFFSNGISLNKEQSDRIYSYTNGWLTAACLILIKHKDGNGDEDIRSVTHLIYSALYEKIPSWLREIFMKMSLFDSFTAEEAAFVCETNITHLTLYNTVKKIPFVRCSYGGNYTMHFLFRSIAELELDQSGFDKNYLYKRGAEWNEDNGFIHFALKYYHKAGDMSRFFHILEDNRCIALYDHTPVMIDSFFKNNPMKENLKHPRAFLPYIYALMIRQDYVEGLRYFREAKYCYEKYENESERSWLLGELYIIETAVEFNNLEIMSECIKNAYEALGRGHSRIFDSNVIFTYGVPEILQLYHCKAGHLKEIVQLEKEYTYYFTEVINGYKGGWDQLFEGEYLFTIGKVKEAKGYSEIACEKAKIRKQICVIISSYFLLLRCEIFLGEKENFFLHMNELEREMEGVIRPQLKMDYDLAVSFLYSRIGKMDKMADWIQNFNLKDCNVIVRSVRSGCITFGFMLINTRQWLRLEILADEMYVPYHLTKHIYVILYSCMFKSMAVYHLNGMEKASEKLAEGLRIAEKDGIVMPFVELGEEIMDILEELAPSMEFAGRIIDYCQEYKHGLKKIQEDNGKIKKDILSKREKEIMELVKHGYKNSDISSQLHIALVTVEKTLSNVYRKLGVKNRTAAIEKINEIYS